jgi:hypothetical protein
MLGFPGFGFRLSSGSQGLAFRALGSGSHPALIRLSRLGFSHGSVTAASSTSGCTSGFVTSVNAGGAGGFRCCTT